MDPGTERAASKKRTFWRGKTSISQHEGARQEKHVPTAPFPGVDQYSSVE